jgi:MFS family permease
VAAPTPITPAHRDSRVALAIVTSAFSAMLLAANLATPLYAVWARQFGFSTAVLALIFAVYALVLIPALLTFGQLSDRLGRRVVIAIGLGLAILALTFFALATGTAWLFAARAALGVAQGMLSGAATAALAELVPAADPRRAALLATMSQAGGSAAGVLLCGVLAQWAPAPEVTPFVAGMITCALAATALAFVPETARRQRGALRVRRPRVPEEIRGAFARVSLTAAAVWAVVAGLFLAVMPSYAGQLVLHSQNLALLALMAALVLVSSCAAQLVVRHGAPPAQAQAAGLVLLAVGLLALVLASPGAQHRPAGHRGDPGRGRPRRGLPSPRRTNSPASRRPNSAPKSARPFTYASTSASRYRSSGSAWSPWPPRCSPRSPRSRPSPAPARSASRPGSCVTAAMPLARPCRIRAAPGTR